MVRQLDRPVDLAVDDEVLARPRPSPSMTVPSPIRMMPSEAGGPTARWPRGDGGRLTDASSASCVSSMVEATSDSFLRSGTPGCRLPFMRRRALPNPRSAPPVPCGTTSAAPTRMSGTPPPGSPASSAPGRTATDGRSPAGGTPGPRASAPPSRLSMRLVEPLGQRAAEDRLDRPGADGRHPRAVDPPPTATVERRIPARHVNRQAPATETPDHTHCRGRPRTRHPTAYNSLSNRTSRSRHPAATSSPSSALTRCNGVLRRPEQLPLPQRRVHLGRRRRAETTAVVHLDREQPATAAEHAPATLRHPSKQRSRSRPAPTCRSAPPEHSQPATPRTGTASPSFTPFVVDAVALQCRSPPDGDAISERIVQRARPGSTSSSPFSQLNQLPQQEYKPRRNATVMVSTSGHPVRRRAAGPARSRP